MTVEHHASRSAISPRRLLIPCAVLLLLALGVRLLVWHYNREAIAPVMSGLTAGYKDDARILARGDLRLFLRGPDPPSNANVIAHPPGYSILLAAIFSLVGESDVAIRLFQIFCDSISVIFVFLISLELVSKRVAVIAGVLAALSPQLAYNSLLLLPDSLSVLPILVAAYLVVRARVTTGSWIKLATAGAMLGVSCWFRPNGLLLPLFFAAFSPIVFKRGMRVRMIVLLIAGAVILIAPLTIRNIAVFDRFIPISLGSGVTFLEGIADYDSDGKTGLKRTDVEVLQEEARVFNRSDYAGSLYNPDGIQRERARVALGIHVIRSRPFWFLGVMIRRAASMLRLERVPAISGSPLVPGSDQSMGVATFASMVSRIPGVILKIVQKLFITAVVLPLALIGIFMLAKSRRPYVLMFLLVVPAYYLCLQSPLHTEYRYVIALHCFFLMLVAVPLNTVIMRLRRTATVSKRAGTE